MSENELDVQQSLPKELRELLADREASRAKVREAEAQVALVRAEVSRIKADIIRIDKDGLIHVNKVMRW